MFFPERIVSISANHRVLEVGPGSTPHPRSDVLLERRFDAAEAAAQRGFTESPKLTKPVVYYDGAAFPFGDNEFDYVICSHVLEHVEDPAFLVSEINRVAPAGYMEFPSIYYEYLHNFQVHLNFLAHDGKTILWMKKSDTPLSAFLPVQKLFYNALNAGHDQLIVALKPQFVLGFEWLKPVTIRAASSILELCANSNVALRANPVVQRSISSRIVSRLRRIAR